VTPLTLLERLDEVAPFLRQWGHELLAADLRAAVIERDNLKAALTSADQYVCNTDAGCHRNCASWRLDQDCDCGYVELCDAVLNVHEEPT